MSATRCPGCATVADPDDLFCESCGRDLAPSGASQRLDDAWREPSSGSVATTTAGRTGTVRLRPAARSTGTPDHLESDLGTAAAVSDRGLRHLRNEDAFGLAAAGEQIAVVVCDGVSTTAYPERASAAAAAAALAHLKPALEASGWTVAAEGGEALTRAVEAAQAAASEVSLLDADSRANVPSTTIVVAVVTAGRAVVGHVGDSRAYVLSEDPDRCRVVTTDDSWAEQAIAAGVAPEVAHADQQAHVITRWLGADAPDATPHVETVLLEEGDVVVVCTDGLWNYFESAAELASAAGPGFARRPPIELATHLVGAALAAGGHDNITVVVVPTHRVPDGAPSDESDETEE